MGVHRHPQILRDRHAGDRHGVLEGHEQTGARTVLGRFIRDLLAAEADLAVGHLQRGVTHDRVRER